VGNGDAGGLARFIVGMIGLELIGSVPVARDRSATGAVRPGRSSTNPISPVISSAPDTRTRTPVGHRWRGT
jgi:hypothetical protein